MGNYCMGEKVRIIHSYTFLVTVMTYRDTTWRSHTQVAWRASNHHGWRQQGGQYTGLIKNKYEKRTSNADNN